MSHRMNLMDAGGLLTLELEGDKTFEDAKTIWQHIVKFTGEKNADRILVVDRTICKLSAVEVMKIERFFSEIGLPRALRVAIAAQDTNINNNMFSETVAVNRGWSNIRAFSDKDAAVAWLSGNS